jgi:hypothetical protein
MVERFPEEKVDCRRMEKDGNNPVPTVRIRPE